MNTENEMLHTHHTDDFPDEDTLCDLAELFKVFGDSTRCKILYVLSATSLAYFIYTIVIFAPKFKQNIITFLRKFRFGNEMLDNYVKEK